jgi:transcription elongation factor GreA
MMIGEAATVRLGSRVRLRYADADEDDEFVLVPPEADRSPLSVSSVSPLGRALLGAHAGERVRVSAPGGVYEVRVKSVQCRDDQ